MGSRQKTDNSRNGQTKMGDKDGKEIDVWRYVSFSFVWQKPFEPSDSITTPCYNEVIDKSNFSVIVLTQSPYEILNYTKLPWSYSNLRDLGYFY